MISTEIVRRSLTQYGEMVGAIFMCDSMDECKHIADASVAMAAYYHQIQDDETELMFHRVRLRAWRQLGMLMKNRVLDEPTRKAKAEKLVRMMQYDTIPKIPYRTVSLILQLAEIDTKTFDEMVEEHATKSIANFLSLTPEARERQRRADEIVKQDEWRDRPKKDRISALASDELDSGIYQDLVEEEEASIEASTGIVGITLDRRDRLQIKEVLFLIKEEVHAVMRQAAFDQRITMQAVLREGLRLWLEANGYEWPSEQQQEND